MAELGPDIRSEDGRQRALQKQLFGAEFPGKSTDGAKWRAWIDKRIQEQEATMRDKRLHWSRHRNFRAGRQWISTRDGRTWRAAPEGKNEVRSTFDVIGPALDFRLGIVSEQKPGFQAHPFGTGIAAREEAEAQQNVATYYYEKLNGLKIMRDAQAAAQTDGVSFLHVFVDRTRGPRIEDVRLIPKDDPRFGMLKSFGYEVRPDGMLAVPLGEGGTVQRPGDAVQTFPAGDIGTRVVLAHEVYFDPESKTVNGPYDPAQWCILRRVRDKASAELELGKTLKTEGGVDDIIDPMYDTTSQVLSGLSGFQRGLPPFPSTRTRRGANVYEYIVYLAPNAGAGLPDGLWCRVLGHEMVKLVDELPGGKIPLARVTDGSSDSEMYPRPVMSAWVGDQIAINALVSKLIEHVRIFGTGRVMAQRGTLVEETYNSIVGSLISWSGSKPDFVQGTRASSDMWNMLTQLVAKIEDKTGWNALARGQVSGSGTFADVSGRALLGARELFERQFGPMIRSTAEGMSEWATLVVDYARWLFDTPRLIPIAGRGDLAKAIESKDLGEESRVFMDPETLTPLPRALRNQMLFDLMEKGLITVAEYRKRAPFAEIRNVTMGDTDQWDRAQMINMTLEERWEELAGVEDPQARFLPEAGGISILWMDEPMVHQSALMELALDERQPQGLRDLAMERWSKYDQLARAKAGTSFPPNEVRGIPLDIMAQFQQLAVQQAAGGQPAGEGGEVPGAGGQPLSSPLPTGGPIAPTESSQQGFQRLGEFGELEAIAQGLQEG